MFVDEWLTEVNEIEFVGSTVEGCNQLVNECQQKNIPYVAKMESVENGMKYTLTATLNNEDTYTMVRDYKNRGGK